MENLNLSFSELVVSGLLNLKNRWSKDYGCSDKEIRLEVDDEEIFLSVGDWLTVYYHPGSEEYLVRMRVFRDVFKYIGRFDIESIGILYEGYNMPNEEKGLFESMCYNIDWDAFDLKATVKRLKGLVPVS